LLGFQKMIITGLIAVRLPHLNFLDPGRDVVPCINGIYYAGVDRQRWVDVFDDEFYAKKSPAEIVRLAQAMKRRNDCTGIDVCQDIDAASKLLGYSNRRSIDNELIVVRSPFLNAKFGSIEIDREVEWIGFDFVGEREWSLIGSGLFMSPQHYSKWLPLINQNGLFDDSSLLAEYARAYEQAVEAGHSEPLANQSVGFEKIAIEVGRFHNK
jgi:hypothetical protein